MFFVVNPKKLVLFARVLVWKDRFCNVNSATLTRPAALQAQVSGLEAQVASLSDKCATLEVIKASAALQPPSALYLLREQLENEREILTLKSVIEQLRQSLEDLAAAAQVLVQSHTRSLHERITLKALPTLCRS